MIERFRRTWAPTREPVTLLLSGGGDSVALFHLLQAVGQRFSALHFVHDGNPEFASRGRDFCLALCEKNGVSLEITEIAGKALMECGDLSWEAACRQFRYAALKGRTGIFLTAHTLDDQAETVVMNLLGGSGLAGLAGIHPRRKDGVVRPLLEFGRSTLRGYLEEHSYSWIEDPTNQDGNDRARMRHNVMPTLLQSYPHLFQTLGRTARRLREDEEYLSTLLEQWIERYYQTPGDHWPLAEVQDLPPSLQARFFRHLWRGLSPDSYRPRGTLMEEALRLIGRGTNEGRVDFPGGWSLVVLGKTLWTHGALGQAEWSGVDDERPFLEVSPTPRNGFESWVITPQRCVRSRRAGDRFRGKSVKKLLASTGEPPWVRDRWPLLVEGEKVVAVYGMRSLEKRQSTANFWLKFSPLALRQGLER